MIENDGYYFRMQKKLAKLEFSNNHSHDKIKEEANEFLKEYLNLSKPKTIASSSHGKLARLRASRKVDHLSPLALSTPKKITHNTNNVMMNTLPDYKRNIIKTSTSSSSSQEPNIPRSVTIISKSSKNKWNADEINKLNELYSTYKRSLPPDKDIWIHFFTQLATKFQVYYPYREKEEIITKLQEMIRHNQIKSPQESAHWNNIRVQSTDLSSTKMLSNIKQSKTISSSSSLAATATGSLSISPPRISVPLSQSANIYKILDEIK